MRIKTNLKAGAKTVTIKPDDTLITLAQKAYGEIISPEDTARIYNANLNIIGVDVCHLPVGQQVFLPDRPLPPQPVPQPYNPVPNPPHPAPVPKPKPLGACTERWGNGVCLYKECPYPPFQMPCN